jgi:hypothetical protein
MVNIIVLWNRIYLDAGLDQPRALRIDVRYRDITGANATYSSCSFRAEAAPIRTIGQW